MRLVWGGEDLVVPFVGRKTGFERGFGECRTAAVLTEGGDLAAGLVFHNWFPEAGVIEISGAAVNSGFMQRGVVQSALSYAFRRVGCQMVVARCGEGNTAVRRICKAIGATETVIPRLRGREAAECILTLTDDAWQASRFAR